MDGWIVVDLRSISAGLYSANLGEDHSFVCLDLKFCFRIFGQWKFTYLWLSSTVALPHFWSMVDFLRGFISKIQNKILPQIGNIYINICSVWQWNSNFIQNNFCDVGCDWPKNWRPKFSSCDKMKNNFKTWNWLMETETLNICSAILIIQNYIGNWQ